MAVAPLFLRRNALRLLRPTGPTSYRPDRFEPGESSIVYFRIVFSAFLHEGEVWLIGSSTHNSTFVDREIVIVVL
jgi:hypothetical protein